MCLRERVLWASQRLLCHVEGTRLMLVQDGVRMFRDRGHEECSIRGYLGCRFQGRDTGERIYRVKVIWGGAFVRGQA